MKRVVVVCLVIGSIWASVASAEMLFTAEPIGQGKWTGLTGYVDNVNVSNNPDLTGPTSYIHVGYGINNKIDLYLQYGTCTVKGLPSPLTLDGSDLGLTFKYQLMDLQSAPVSVAFHATVRFTHYIGGGGLDSNQAGNTSRIGLVVSKVIPPFIPYAGLAYQASTLNGNTDYILDPSIGTSIAWSKQGVFFIEDTYQMYYPHAGSDYNSNQWAYGVGYTL